MEIEKAIKTLLTIIPRTRLQVDALSSAISALRAQQEREKGCEMCNGRDALLLRKAHKYCKYCGRRLKEAEEDGR